MDTTLLRAVFELKRQQLILVKLNPATSDLLEDAYVYAIADRISPLFHVEGFRDPFAGAYEVSYELVERVHARCYDKGEKGTHLSFRNLEQEFRKQVDRMELVSILRYAHLADRLSEAVLEGLLGGMCPEEAKGIGWEFNPHEDLRIV